jgi:hypothetical protein
MKIVVPVLLALIAVPLASAADAAVKLSNNSCGKQPRTDFCRLRGYDPKPVKDPIPFTLGAGETEQKTTPSPLTTQQR